MFYKTVMLYRKLDILYISKNKIENTSRILKENTMLPMNGRRQPPKTHQTQPEMKAYFLPVSLQYSATRVYLKR